MKSNYYHNINPLLNSGCLHLDKASIVATWYAEEVSKMPLRGEAEKVEFFNFFLRKESQYKVTRKCSTAFLPPLSASSVDTP